MHLKIHRPRSGLSAETRREFQLCISRYIAHVLGFQLKREGNYDDFKNNNVLEDINQGMAKFAWDELFDVKDSGWCRSLSLKDPLYINGGTSNDLIWRADWGVGGSYPGLDGMIVEGLAMQWEGGLNPE
jgi:hypothetical protein